MAYYVLFDEDGKYMGYSTFKKMAKGLIDQRKSFQKFQLKKVKEKDEIFDDKMKKDLIMSEGDIFDYFGTFLFEHEQDTIHVNCLEYYNTCYKSISAYFQIIEYIKFNDREKELIAKFSEDMVKLTHCIEAEYYTSEDPYSRCFNLHKLAIKYLKDMYKGEKKK